MLVLKQAWVLVCVWLQTQQHLFHAIWSNLPAKQILLDACFCSAGMPPQQLYPVYKYWLAAAQSAHSFAVKPCSKLALCNAVLVLTTALALFVSGLYESLLRPWFRFSFSWTRHNKLYWALVLTVALGFVISAPFTITSAYDVHEHSMLPQWTAREILPSQSSVHCRHHTEVDQRRTALPNLPTTSDSILGPKLTGALTAAAEMDPMLSAATPPEFWTVTVSQPMLSAEPDVQSSAVPDRVDLVISHDAATDPAGITSVRSPDPLQMPPSIISDNSHWLRMLWPRLPFMAHSAWSATHSEKSTIDPQTAVVKCSTAITHHPLARSVPRVSQISCSSQLIQLLPPLKTQLLSQMGFVPYIGSTAVARYVPPAVIAPKADMSSSRRMTVQTSPNSLDLPATYATKRLHDCNSLDQGCISSTLGSAASSNKIICLSFHQDSLLSSATEGAFRGTFSYLPDRMRQQLQWWWQSAVNLFSISEVRAFWNSTSATTNNKAVLNANNNLPNLSELNLLHACAVCNFLHCQQH